MPRGLDRDHPRAELLKYKSLSAGMNVGRPEWVSGPDAAGHVPDLWDQLHPLVEWVVRHVAP